MPLMRQSLIFAVTTDPTDRTNASAHSGGWSESHWFNGNPYTLQRWQSWANVRAGMLPNQCSVIGFRSQQYTIVGNKLEPALSQTGVLNVPGNTGFSLNLPQDSLEINFTLFGKSNVIKHKITAIPDTCVVNGEYQPTTAFQSRVQAYGNFVVGTGAGPVGIPSLQAAAAVVRDLSVPSLRVISITAQGVVATAAALGVVVNTDSLIFKHVKDDNGNPVKGSYLIVASTINAAGQYVYTLQDYTGQIVTKPNGLVRRDALTIGTCFGFSIGRAVIRKIGRPSASYRGRRSKQRV